MEAMVQGMVVLPKLATQCDCVSWPSGARWGKIGRSWIQRKHILRITTPGNGFPLLCIVSPHQGLSKTFQPSIAACIYCQAPMDSKPDTVAFALLDFTRVWESRRWNAYSIFTEDTLSCSCQRYSQTLTKLFLRHRNKEQPATGYCSAPCRKVCVRYHTYR